MANPGSRYAALARAQSAGDKQATRTLANTILGNSALPRTNDFSAPTEHPDAATDYSPYQFAPVGVPSTAQLLSKDRGDGTFVENLHGTPLQIDPHSIRSLFGTSYVGHPGDLESFIPIWGAEREGIADFQEGDWPGAAFNGVLTAADIFPPDSLFTSAIAGVSKKGGNGLVKLNGHSWTATRNWLRDIGHLAPGEIGHHWLIPQRQWGKAVPESIKNQAWNIKALKSRMEHNRVEGKFSHEEGGGPPYGLPLRFWYGTPRWFKGMIASLIGHTGDVATNHGLLGPSPTDAPPDDQQTSSAPQQ